MRPDHLERPAFVYVRQSTLFQVRENTASTARQYDLTQRAWDLGWSEASITVIDQDQGRSGSSAIDRDGFQLLIAQVGLGQAGAVLSLEASRLARSCSDWYRLLEICALVVAGPRAGRPVRPADERSLHRQRHHAQLRMHPGPQATGRTHLSVRPR